ncbi:MAG TPA: L-threonylcarbamoyladenylate synthase [Candidatus Polarisedimenticolia bacterium]|nr:L-threonylcarbamoyladenylate synthase [Candidatus Polarisedimenticolia bacterium]
MKRIQTIDPERPDGALLHQAGRLLHAGRLVAYPTETFYGLAADPFNPQAVERVFAAKGRPERMALPLIAPDEASVMTCVREFPEPARRLAAAFWPGPLTLVLPASRMLPARLLGGGHTVGVRISPHPIASALARAAGGPIVATSANRSGRPAPSTAEEVENALGDEIDLILDGGSTRGGTASTVLDLTSDPPRVVRSGAVLLTAVERVLGRALG